MSFVRKRSLWERRNAFLAREIRSQLLRQQEAAMRSLVVLGSLGLYLLWIAARGLYKFAQNVVRIGSAIFLEGELVQHQRPGVPPKKIYEVQRPRLPW